jgi:hypothetical protein
MFLGDEVWNFLLSLFLADSRGERLTGRGLITQEGCSAEVGRRWLIYLTHIEYVLGDGDGNLDVPLTLTPDCLNRVEEWLVDARSDIAATALGNGSLI